MHCAHVSAKVSKLCERRVEEGRPRSFSLLSAAAEEDGREEEEEEERGKSSKARRVRKARMQSITEVTEELEKEVGEGEGEETDDKEASA